MYDFTFDYRNIAYFNAVPSFANPFASGGFDQQSFDIGRRMLSVNLELHPSKHIVPYLAFDHNSGSGDGIGTWLTDEPLASLLLPLPKNVFWNTEWRGYQMNEAFYWYEGFRTNTFTTGLRLTR